MATPPAKCATRQPRPGRRSSREMARPPEKCATRQPRPGRRSPTRQPRPGRRSVPGADPPSPQDAFENAATNKNQLDCLCDYARLLGFKATSQHGEPATYTSCSNSPPLCSYSFACPCPVLRGRRAGSSSDERGPVNIVAISDAVSGVGLLGRLQPPLRRRSRARCPRRGSRPLWTRA